MKSCGVDILGMFYSILPITIILLSLLAIVLIILKKFPQLTAVEVEKIVEVQQAQIKENIQLQKFNRSLVSLWGKIKSQLGKFQAVSGFWKKTQSKFRVFVHNLKERHKKLIEAEMAKRSIQVKEPTPEAIQEVGSLLKQADEAVDQKNNSLAERLYIEVIKQDSKNIEAYRGLGRLYFNTKKFKESAETFDYLLKLKPDDVRAFNRLGMIAEVHGRWEEAVKYFEEAVKLDSTAAIRFFDLGRAYAALNKPALALTNFSWAAEIEPNNPKYLDQVLEMSIITKDKDLAKETLRRLKAVNPENQKLQEFEDRVKRVD
ncbi:MAG: tetratricopeptide repeat protein [Patescibacteria group bacterium]